MKIRKAKKCEKLQKRIAKAEAELNELYEKLESAEETKQHSAIDHLEFFMKRAQPKMKNVRVLFKELQEERQTAHS
jgi:uncharacterized coiled-coil protein SlyX